MRVTSLYDGIAQILNEKKLKAWKNTSMFFNGGSLAVEIYKNKFDKDIKLKLSKLFVGELINRWC